MLLHDPAKGNSATQWRFLHWCHLNQQCFEHDVLHMGPSHVAVEDAWCFSLEPAPKAVAAAVHKLARLIDLPAAHQGQDYYE